MSIMSYTNVDVRSFEKAVEVLNGRDSKLIGLNTRIARNLDGTIGITLHSTELVKFHPDNKTVEVTTGGWNTVTTRERLNRYLPGGLRVSTMKGVCYVWNGSWDNRRLFVDGTKIVDGNIDAFPLPDGADKEASKLRRKVSNYSKAYVKALRDGKVKAPGAGDCFYCGMVVSEPDGDKGKTLGEAFTDRTHLDEHMREKYFVPSLLARAIKVFPVSQVAQWCLASQWAENATAEAKESLNSAWNDIGWNQLEKSLRRYILRQYGIDGR